MKLLPMCTKFSWCPSGVHVARKIHHLPAMWTSNGSLKILDTSSVKIIIDKISISHSINCSRLCLHKLTKLIQWFPYNNEYVLKTNSWFLKTNIWPAIEAKRLSQKIYILSIKNCDIKLSDLLIFKNYNCDA